MGLVNCGECGKEVSNKARLCPHCGIPFSNSAPLAGGAAAARAKAPNRTRVLALVLIAVLVAVAPGAWRATEAARQSAGLAPAPRFVVDNAGGSDGCTVLGDYCMRIECAVFNIGDAHGATSVLGVLFENGEMVATHRATRQLAPGQRDTVRFEFPEARMSKDHKYRCEVATT